jgi:parallel beta-helix repeat protein
MNKKLLSLVVTTLVANLITLGHEVAQAGHVVCGDTILTDTKLDESLSCTGDGINIGADGITLNLNGFTIAGDPFTGIGVRSFGFHDVVVKNGAISRFSDGIRTDSGVTGLNLVDLTFSGQSASSIVIINSGKVEINRVSISQPPGGDGNAEAIRLHGVDDAKVTNVTVDGGFFGVLAIETTELAVIGNAFSNIGTGIRIIGSADVNIKKNRIAGTDFGSGCHAGIDLADVPSTDVRIVGNEITGCFLGIFVPESTPVTGMVLGRNNIYSNSFRGILLSDTTDSNIFSNRVHLNGVHVNGGCDICVGIHLVGGSIGNIVRMNKVTGHDGGDLGHEEDSSPNHWIGNTCDTSFGADIDCP